MPRKTSGINGRPPKKIDQKQFESACFIQCTYDEICSLFDVTDKTLNKWCRETYGTTFSEVYRIKKQGGKTSLRRMQWKNAEKGNTTMQIWLGKQLLGQRDKHETEISGGLDIKVDWGNEDSETQNFD